VALVDSNLCTFAASKWNCIQAPFHPSAVTLDSSNVYIADGSTIQRWDGKQFNDVAKDLGDIRGLQMVPSSKDQKNLLLAMGSLNVNNLVLGAALFDGQHWFPYASISNGVIQLIRPFKNLLWEPRSLLPIPLVILVSAAISLGVIFIITLLSLLAAYVTGKRSGYTAVPQKLAFERGGNQRKTAIPRDIVGALTDAAVANQYQLIEYKTFRVKYPFRAEQAGEMDLDPGEIIYVIDNSDEHWWLGMVDRGPNSPAAQGVFPASFVEQVI